MTPAMFDFNASPASRSVDAAVYRQSGSLSQERSVRRRSWFAELIIAPFQDIDERVRVKR